MGRKEFQDAEANAWPVRGSHVVAPVSHFMLLFPANIYLICLKQCPHDGTCPLYHPGSSRLVCGFSQRIQRPSFVRKTKHSGVGHEDIEYSYVVIRRGIRPHATTMFGRVGQIGMRESAKEASSSAPMKELKLHNERETAFDAAMEDIPALASETVIAERDREPASEAGLQEALRQESYSWPRLVFPPLKKSGHIILDSCTAEGVLYTAIMITS